MFGFLKKASSVTAIKIAENELSRLDESLSNLKTGRDILEQRCKDSICELLPRYVYDDHMIQAYAHITYDPVFNKWVFDLQKEALNYPDNDVRREIVGVAIALFSAMGASIGTSGRKEAIDRALAYCGIKK